MLVGQVVVLIRLFTAEGEALAKPTGQTLARWLVLEAIGERPATVAAIARGMVLSRQSVQRVADLLVRDGLATYEENPRHRRAKLLRPTLEGGQVLGSIREAQRVWADALGAQIGEADLRAASVVLERVLGALMGRTRTAAEGGAAAGPAGDLGRPRRLRRPRASSPPMSSAE